MRKILCDFEIQTGHPIQARGPDIVLTRRIENTVKISGVEKAVEHNRDEDISYCYCYVWTNLQRRGKETVTRIIK